MPRVMQRSHVSKSYSESNVSTSLSDTAQLLRICADSRLPSSVISGSLPFGGSTMSAVCRCGAVGSVLPALNAVPSSPDFIAVLYRSTRPFAASTRALNSSSVRNALFGSQGGAGGPPARDPPAHRSKGTLPTNEIGHVPWRSGSPHAVFGCFHPAGVPTNMFFSVG